MLTLSAQPVLTCLSRLHTQRLSMNKSDWPDLLQQLANEDRKQAKRDAGREDMKWQINVEVHDPNIGLVSACICL